jgi:gamma-glutamylputrescine oxidase
MNLLTADRELARDSYYAAVTPPATHCAPLEEAIDADVAIVGGGLAGLSAAIELADRGFSVALLEARQLGSGASGRNGGQVIHGLACDPSVIESQLGLDDARLVWRMSIEAMDLLKARCARFAIDCEWRDGFLGLAVNARKGRELQAWADRLEAVYEYPLSRITPADMPRWIASPRYHSAVHDARSGHLNPLKYCHGLARAAQSLGVRLYEDSAVIALERHSPLLLRTARGSVNARHALLAGNVYLRGLAASLEARIMPLATYIVSTERLGAELAASLIPSRAAASDTNGALDYFRVSADDRLIFGGRVSYSTRTPRDLASSLQRRMTSAFPQLRDARIAHAWGGFIDITMNRAPDFGRLADAPNVYYVQGFSGHGLALSGLAGRLVAEAMAGDASRFDTFARLRHRRFPGGRLLRMPALVLGMAYYRLKDLL